MKRIYTYGAKPAERNLTVDCIRRAKGHRKLTQTNPANAVETQAAVAAGIDTLCCGFHQFDEVRTAAPKTFLTGATILTDCPTDEETIRAAFSMMERGADAIYTPRRPEFIKMLADEGIPVMGHLGLVPRKSTWVGGLRSFGKTAAEANCLFEQFKRLEDAGAFAVEVECVPENLMREINLRTSLITFSLGSGKYCDVTYLFASDILGASESLPRHAKAFADFKKWEIELQNDRVRAFKEFYEESINESFPASKNSTQMKNEELQNFLERLRDSCDLTFVIVTMSQSHDVLSTQTTLGARES